MTQHVTLVLLSLLLWTTCSTPENKVETNAIDEMNVEKQAFGMAPEGPVEQYTLSNTNGMTVKIITYGGIITHLTAPDRNGVYEDVVLGFDSLAAYLQPHPYFGAIIGRYGNRIGGARFSLDGKEYPLAANNGPNSLHGGLVGFDKVLWSATEVRNEERVGIKLTRTSPDMEEGFPGNLEVTMSYYLDQENRLWMEYEAVTDKPTICNLTNHSYFNLKGAGNGTIEDHVIRFSARHYSPVDSTLIPIKGMASVRNTPFDFLHPKTIRSGLNDPHEQIQIGGGFDHNMVLGGNGSELKLAATVYEPNTGRLMEVYTEEPGLQFYTGNFLDGSITGKGGKSYPKHAAFCMETQHYPDSPNQSMFPSTRLDPGETYRTVTMHAFSTRNQSL
ncbi:MAG: galactose mutarotase [Saprospiraceae bacterium]|nr:galactose mutarotase [Saprospiraceae bacterium]